MTLREFLRRASGNAVPPPLPAPTQPVAVVGDVHGCHDLLSALLDELTRHPEAATLRVIVAGDMIDRGPDSAAVLELLFALSRLPAPFAEVRCLMGNHERMLLDFLKTPDKHAARWLAHGGGTTLTSFGVTGIYSRTAQRTGDGTALLRWREALLAALGAGRLDWLTALPLYWQDDTLFVSHAGANPGRSIPRQTERDLLWGSYRHTGARRRDGLWVAQGHVVVPKPSLQDGRILIDTGAWKTGRLSAALFSRAGLSFVQTETSGLPPLACTRL